MRRSNLVEKAQMQIRDMILQKEYDENHYLPSEGALSEKFGISRVTVREAVRSLEVRGFLRREHGKGILVTDNSVQTMTRFISDMLVMNYSDMLELIEVRSIVEVEAARLAASRAGDRDLEAMRKSIAVLESVKAMNDAYYEADMEFHVSLVEAAGNNLLNTFVNAYTPILKNVIVASSMVDYCIEDRYHFHRRVYDCVAAGDGDGAAGEMRRHMRATQDNFMASLNEKAGASEGSQGARVKRPAIRKRREGSPGKQKGRD